MTRITSIQAACIVVVAAGVLALSQATSFANPTNEAPNAALKAHGTVKGAKPGSADAKAAVAKLYAICDRLEQKAIKLQDAKKNNPASLPYRELGSDFAELWKAMRDAQHLTVMGEPAGGDLHSKIMMIKKEVGMLAYMGLKSPRASQYTAKILDKLKKETQKRERFLDQQVALIQKGQFATAEAALEKFGVELEAQIVYFSPKVREPFVKRFTAVLAGCDTELVRERRKAYQNQVKKVMIANLASVNLLKSEATRIGGELASGGTAKVDSNANANAAEVIAYLGKLWGNASAALVRNYALQVAFSSRPPSQILTTAMQPVKQLETTAKDAIISVITTSASKTSPEQIPTLYPQVLEQLSIIDRRMGGFAVSNECEPALKELAGVNPTFATQVAAYQRATSEALRWRKTFAMQKAKTLSAKYASTDSYAARKVAVTVSNRPAMYGNISSAKRLLLTPSFGQPAAWSVFEASEFLFKTKASTRQSIRISPSSRTSVVPFSNSHYANVAVGLQIENEVDALKSTLLIDEQHAALSIEAADAISAATLREFESVGGEIRKIHLEGVVTRFAGLPNVAFPLVPLGSLPTLTDTPVLSQTCWRFDIQPHWVHHKYFTFYVPAAVNASSVTSVSR